LDESDLIRQVKLLLQQRRGIHVNEQRLIVHDSWQHATLLRVAPPLLLANVLEEISAELQLDGTLHDQAVCNGKFQVTVLDTERAGLACFKLTPKDPQVKYKVHPNMSRNAYDTEDLLIHRNSNQFRLYNPVSLLKWQLKSSDLEFLPVELSFSATSSTCGTRAILEVELKNTRILIEDIRISFLSLAPTAKPPSLCDADFAPTAKPPSICNADVGEATFQDSALHWQIPALNVTESKARLTFSVDADPVSVKPDHFKALVRDHMQCPLEIIDCYQQGTNEHIKFECEVLQTYSLTLI